MIEHPTPREIPFNYTSADDRQAIALLLGPAVWQRLEELRTRRVTGGAPGCSCGSSGRS